MPKPRSISNATVLGLIAAHLAIVLPLAFLLPIWADEASTLYTTQHGFFSAFQNAATNEKQAPLYFWIVGLWRSLSDSIFFARLFSVICVAIAIKLFSGLASRLLDPRPAYIAAAFFALHPYLIWAALEIRVYALVILISIVVLRLFLYAFWDGEASWPRRIAFLAAAISALYTNYYLGFLLAGLFVGLIVTRRWRAAAWYAGFGAIAGLAFLPFVLVMSSQLAVNTSGYQAPRSLFDGVQRLWRHFLTFVLPAGVFPEGDSWIHFVRVWVVRALGVIAAIFAIKHRDRLTERTAAMFAVTATVFIGLLTAYFIVGPAYIEIRHLAVIFVPLILFLASLIVDLFKKPATQSTVLVPAMGVLIFFAFSIATLHPGMTKRGDWARVGAFIEQNERDGQPIIVFTTFDALALPYHYHGRNRVLPDEKFFAFEQEAEFGSVDSLRRQTDFVISEIPPEAETIWLAVNEKCIATDACVPLQNFITANYTIEIEQDFYLERVFLLRRKQ